MKTKTTSNPNPDIQRINEDRANQRDFLNQTFTATGERIIEHDNDNHTTLFGYRNLRVWNPHIKKWICLTAKDEDKFIVINEDLSTAATEFWARWKIFVQRVFNVQFIRIEDTSAPSQSFFLPSQQYNQR